MAARATVLVIDDEAPIRIIIRRMLEPEVCRVLEAADAEAGLRMIGRGDPPIDAVLTDWIMSGLHGLDVVEVLHRHRPGLPVAVISAYTSSIHPIIRSGDGLRILQKPFTRPDLRQAVEEMIERAGCSTRSADPVDLVRAAWALHEARAIAR